jgi:CheY-like chemotaxis protein
LDNLPVRPFTLRAASSVFFTWPFFKAPWAAPREEQITEARLMSLKIMVADDEAKTAQLMRSLATPLGHTVLPFGDYQAAGQKGETQRFDVAFVGMRLPEPGGLELAHRIRNSKVNRETIIVMLSATDDVASLRKAFGEGADLVVTKPISADRLRRMLAAMDLPEWKGKRHTARLPLFTEVSCTWDGRQFPLRSVNISESGMLLQPAIDAEVGQEVALEFKIAEVRASLNVQAHIIRKEGTERVGMEFISLTPENQNAIHLYVTGHLERRTPRESLNLGPRRMFRP